MQRVVRSQSGWKLFRCSIALVCGALGLASPSLGDEAKKEDAPAAKAAPRRLAVPLRLNLSGIRKAEPAATPPAAAADANLDKALTVATHKQATIVNANVSGQKQIKIACFCLTPDDRILVGGMAEVGELRVFDSHGTFLETWKLPVNPEAVFARGDGATFVAGDGQLLKLSSTGKVELQQVAPHAAALREHPEKLREEVIAQAKQRAEQLGRQTKVYDQMIERADAEIKKLTDQLAALKKSPDSDAAAAANQSTPEAPVVSNVAALEQRLAMYKQQKEAYANAKIQYDEAIKSQGQTSGELTDAKIDELVKASMVFKQKASSISCEGDDVFVATRAATGYGFSIWRTDKEFGNGKMIVEGLSGCCGQMDCKANKDGVFVAENSKHRVRRFDRDGKEINNWGVGARTGLEGFGSCCNPMNVAFGPASAIYTAEDDTGRIKRYSAEGKLLGLVGAVELKPGCKNVSIAVSSDGSRVYMLDITRNHLVQMDARPADEVAADVKKLKDSPAPAKPAAEAGAAAPAASPAPAASAVPAVPAARPRLVLRRVQPAAPPAQAEKE